MPKKNYYMPAIKKQKEPISLIIYAFVACFFAGIYAGMAIALYLWK